MRRKATTEEIEFCQKIGATPFPDGMIEVVVEREPLMSDEEMRKMGAGNEAYAWDCAECVRDFYEAKITSGELRVVKEVRWRKRPIGCEECGHPWSMLLSMSKYCPGCGNKISYATDPNT